MSKWIKVKHRLPENDHFVLTFRPNKPMKINWYSSHNESWMMDKHYSDINHDNITHWMELPEPPE